MCREHVFLRIVQKPELNYTVYLPSNGGILRLAFMEWLWVPSAAHYSHAHLSDDINIVSFLCLFFIFCQISGLLRMPDI